MAGKNLLQTVVRIGAYRANSNTPNSAGQGYWYRLAGAIVAAQDDQTGLPDPPFIV